MIVKELTVPLKLQAVQCLEKRMLSTHHQYPQILADLAKRKAGYYGERSLCYYFNQLPQPPISFITFASNNMNLYLRWMFSSFFLPLH
ncbi:hypothetical protein [Bacillus sp. Y1]|nr:hypothetical protein [Bacillus sp. Y1]